MANVKIKSPKGELRWVTITGEGKENLSGKMQYVASVVIDESVPEHKAFIDQVNEFWEDNKPAKYNLAPKSTGIYPLKEKDADGNAVEVPGKFYVQFKTGTTFQDGAEKVIATYNAKGKKVSLGSQTIGNGSVGIIAGSMGIYENKKGNAILNAGVTLYLDAIQITKFVPYEHDAGFTAQDDDEDGWTGEDDSFEGVTEESAPKAAPRL